MSDFYEDVDCMQEKDQSQALRCSNETVLLRLMVQREILAAGDK